MKKIYEYIIKLPIYRWSDIIELSIIMAIIILLLTS